MWATIALILAVLLASAILRALITGDSTMSATRAAHDHSPAVDGQPIGHRPAPPAHHAALYGRPINPPADRSSSPASSASSRSPADDPATRVREDDGEIDVGEIVGEIAPPVVAEAVCDLSGVADPS